MKKIFVFNEDIPFLEQKKQVLSFLSTFQKAEKISAVLDGVSIQGEGSRHFSFASIYQPESKVKCVKAGYQEYLYSAEMEPAETYIILCPDNPTALGKVITKIKKSTVPIMALLLIEDLAPTMSPVDPTAAKPLPEKKDEQKEKEQAENEKRLQQKLRRARAALFFSKLLLVSGGALLLAAAVIYGKGRFF